jgi:DNA-binding CsgD family transcriptional regulator
MNSLYGTTTLSPKEARIVSLIVEGMTAAEIGSDLGITAHVVKNYLRVIYDKTGMSNRLELALWALKCWESKLNRRTP